MPMRPLIARLGHPGMPPGARVYTVVGLDELGMFGVWRVVIFNRFGMPAADAGEIASSSLDRSFPPPPYRILKPVITGSCRVF